MESLSKILDDQLKAKGMSQRQLADKLGTDRSNLNKRINRETMQFSELRKVCKVLESEVSLDPVEK